MIEVHGKPVYQTTEEILRPERTAILVVDMQNDLVSPEGWSAKRGHDVGPKLEILETAPQDHRSGTPGRRTHRLHRLHPRRSALGHGPGVDLLLLQRQRRPRDADGGPGRSLRQDLGLGSGAELAPEPEDFIIEKTRRGGFWATNLDKALRGHGIESVVVTGTATAGCVLDTAVGAHAYDYYTAVLTDGVAETNQERHQKGLAVMVDRYVSVTSDELVALWSRVPQRAL